MLFLLSISKNLILSEIFNDLMEVISSTLIHFECSAPHFINEKESYPLIKALNSTGMEGIILHGHRSWQVNKQKKA